MLMANIMLNRDKGSKLGKSNITTKKYLFSKAS